MADSSLSQLASEETTQAHEIVLLKDESRRGEESWMLKVRKRVKRRDYSEVEDFVGSRKSLQRQ